MLRRVSPVKLRDIEHRSTTQVFEAFRVRHDGTHEGVFVERFDRGPSMRQRLNSLGGIDHGLALSLWRARVAGVRPDAPTTNTSGGWRATMAG